MRRQADPTTTIEYNAADGTLRTLAADADGVIVPETPEDDQVLDSFGLPEAHTKPAAKAPQEGI